MNKQVLEALLEYIDARFVYESCKYDRIGAPLKRRETAAKNLEDILSYLKRLVEEQEESK